MEWLRRSAKQYTLPQRPRAHSKVRQSPLKAASMATTMKMIPTSIVWTRPTSLPAIPIRVLAARPEERVIRAAVVVVVLVVVVLVVPEVLASNLQVSPEGHGLRRGLLLSRRFCNVTILRD